MIKLLNLINENPIIQQVIAKIVAGTVLLPIKGVSERLRELINKRKEKNAELTEDDCKDLKLTQDEINRLIKEINELQESNIILQENVEGNNEIKGLTSQNCTKDIKQSNKKGDNVITFA